MTPGMLSHRGRVLLASPAVFLLHARLAREDVASLRVSQARTAASLDRLAAVLSERR